MFPLLQRSDKEGLGDPRKSLSAVGATHRSPEFGDLNHAEVFLGRVQHPLDWSSSPSPARGSVLHEWSLVQRKSGWVVVRKTRPKTVDTGTAVDFVVPTRFGSPRVKTVSPEFLVQRDLRLKMCLKPINARRPNRVLGQDSVLFLHLGKPFLVLLQVRTMVRFKAKLFVGQSRLLHDLVVNRVMDKCLVVVARIIGEVVVLISWEKKREISLNFRLVVSSGYPFLPFRRRLHELRLSPNVDPEGDAISFHLVSQSARAPKLENGTEVGLLEHVEVGLR